MSKVKGRFKEELTSAISKTMENMTFEDVTFIDDQEAVEPVSKNKYWAILPVKEPFQGELVLEVPKECGRNLALEAFGEIDVTPDDEVVEDIVAEMLNTLTGSFLKVLVSKDEIFHLGLPQKGQGELPPLKETSVSVYLTVGDHCLCVSYMGNDFSELLKE